MKGICQRYDCTTGETVREEYDFEQKPIIQKEDALTRALKKKGLLTQAEIEAEKC